MSAGAGRSRRRPRLKGSRREEAAFHRRPPFSRMPWALLCCLPWWSHGLDSHGVSSAHRKSGITGTTAPLAPAAPRHPVPVICCHTTAAAYARSRANRLCRDADREIAAVHTMFAVGTGSDHPRCAPGIPHHDNRPLSTNGIPLQIMKGVSVIEFVGCTSGGEAMRGRPQPRKRFWAPPPPHHSGLPPRIYGIPWQAVEGFTRWHSRCGTIADILFPTVPYTAAPTHPSPRHNTPTGLMACRGRG